MMAGELTLIERAHALDSAFSKHMLKDGYGAKMPRVTRKPDLQTILEFTPMSDMVPTDMARMARNG